MMNVLFFMLGASIALSPINSNESREDVPEIRDTLAESVVTGTRLAVKRELLPVPVTVVGREEIARSDAFTVLPSLMNNIPGLFVSSRGVSGYGVSNGAAGGINLRGLGAGSGRILILIDGHPQFESIYGHPVADEYLGANVSRVEVSRGSSSVLYGSNAMGGAINIITRKPEKDGNSIDLKLMGGSYGTFRGSFNDSYRKGRFSASVSASYDRTDGHRANSAYNSKGAYAKAAYDLSQHWKVSAFASAMNAYSENPGTEDAPMYEGTADVVRMMTGLSFDNKYEKTSGSVSLFYNYGKHTINDGHTASEDPQEYLFHASDYMYGATIYQGVNIFTGNTLTGGVDIKLYGGDAYRDPVNEIYADNIHLYEYAGYLFDQQSFGRFLLNAGLRLERHKLYGFEWVPQAGVSFRAARNTTLKLSASKGFRTPNMRELYMYRVANENLKPEEAWTFDFTAHQKAFNGRLEGELSLYHIKGSNIIEVVQIDGVPQNHNVGDFANSGVELSLKLHASENLVFNGNYSFLHMDEAITGAPEYKLFVEGCYHVGKFDFSVSALGIGGLYLSTGDSPVKEKYVDLCARVSYSPVKSLSLFVKGENLANVKYENLLGFPMPGITAFGGISVSL